MLTACPSVHTTSASKNHRRSSAGGRFQSMTPTKAKAGRLRKKADKKFDEIGHPRTAIKAPKNWGNEAAFKYAWCANDGVNAAPTMNSPARIPTAINCLRV